MSDLIATLAALWNSTPTLGAVALLTLKASSILLLTGVAAAVLRLSAARRHVLWAASIAAAVVLPFMTLSMPAWHIPLRYEPQRQTAALQSTTTGERAAVPGATISAAQDAPRVRSPSVPNQAASGTPALGSERALGWPQLLFAIWLIGALLALTPWIAGVVVRLKLARSASDLLPAPWERSVRALRAAGEVPARVRICASSRCTMPMTWGTLRPTILLPARTSWQEGERRNALLHELAHVRRADYAVKLLSRLLCVMYWFNPVAWLAARAERLAREQACDDAVLRNGSTASAYAQQLLDVAQRAQITVAVAALTMARRSGLARRLRAILDGAHDRAPTGRLLASLAAGAVCVVVPPIAALAPDWVRVAAAPNESVLPLVEAAPSVAKAQVSSAVAPSPSLLAQQATACVPGPRKSASSISRESSSRGKEPTLHVKWSNSGCRIELQARGTFTLSPNADDVVALSAGGSFELEQEDGGRERRVRIVPGDGAALTRTYWEDGERTEWNADAAAWFARTLVLLDRRTAFAVETRLPMLLRQGGVSAVMAEISQMESTYPQRIYYSRLVETLPLTPPQLTRILEEATRSFDSGYEKAELSLHIARQPAFDQSVHLAYAEMARSIDSDYEKRRALGGLLERKDLEPQVVRTMLEATEGIESDFELAELLVAIDRRYSVNEATAPYYLRALETIDSDYEQRRVMASLMSLGGLSSVVTQEMLAIAARSMRGFELAELLVAVARNGSLNEGANSEFFDAAKKIDSDYEKRRVLEALLRRRQLTTFQVEGILATASGIKSDFECAELLVGVARAAKIDDGLRPAFEKAAATIESEHEYGRVMTALRPSGQR